MAGKKGSDEKSKLLELQQRKKYVDDDSDESNTGVENSNQTGSMSQQEASDWIENNIKVYERTKDSAGGGDLRLVSTNSYGDIQIPNSRKTSKVNR